MGIRLFTRGEERGLGRNKGAFGKHANSHGSAFQSYSQLTVR